MSNENNSSFVCREKSIKPHCFCHYCIIEIKSGDKNVKHWTTTQWHLGVHDLTSNREWKYFCILEIKMAHKTKVDQQHRFRRIFFPDSFWPQEAKIRVLTLLYTMKFGHVSPLKELEHFFLMSYTPPEYLILKLSQLAI